MTLMTYFKLFHTYFANTNRNVKLHRYWSTDIVSYGSADITEIQSSVRSSAQVSQLVRYESAAARISLICPD